MARGKKQSLSAEEMLEQALVPEDEQPYEVPGNWVWTRLGKLGRVKGGKRLPPGHVLQEEVTSRPYIRVTDIEHNSVNYEKVKYVSEDTFNKIRNYTISKNDLFISIAGTIGRVGMIPESLNGANLTENAAKITEFNSLEQKYLMYLLLSNDLQNQIKQSTIATTQAKLALNRIENLVLPLPPIAEQQRIVDRIESLFAKLDQAKELAQNALDSFDTRKAAILHKAFTGELTAKWREEHGVGMDSWVKKTFNQVADIKSNLVDPSSYMDNPHIAPDNIERRTGRLLEYRTIREDGVTSGKHKFSKGQILYSKIRPYLSKVVLVDFNGLCSADMYPIEAKEDTKYLWYYMLSDEFLEQASSAGSRSVLPKINQKELSAVKVMIPSWNEQREVVRILDNLLAREIETKDLANVIDHIEVMKKSILARAFRGVLGTNDTSEESALELLKETVLQ
ncbi:restriction endonuclease subunit S [Paenibacillus daejeonensis]|uniref:restriction endonuclease subunit S n=1 Tax=Paenibacillus daejeonensis TaxID=135193 RepID=UPI000361CEA1|nr:restriction endonuclease subunit S [Paenibacillus daejeonensis]